MILSTTAPEVFLANAVTDSMILCIESGRIKFCNDAFTKGILETREHIEGQDLSEVTFLSQSSKADLLLKIHQCTESPENLEGIEVPVTFNGTSHSRHPFTKATFHPYSSDKIFLMFKKESPAIEHTSQIHAHGNEIPHLLHNFAKKTQEGLIVFQRIEDDDFKFLYLNDSAGRFYSSVGRPNPVGQKFTEVASHSEWKTRWNYAATEASRTQKPTEYDCPSLFNKDDVKCFTFHEVEPNVYACTVKTQEQTRLMSKQIEGVIKHRTSELEEAIHAKSRFFAVMSHEIRTPLSGVLGMLSLLSETELPSQSRDMLNTAHVCGEQLMSVINDILDISKMDENKVEIEQSPISIRSTIEDSLDVVSFNSHTKHLELISDIDPKLQDMIFGDSTRIRQVLVNLLSNAVKFTMQGNVVLSASSTDLGDGKVELTFSVQDDGIGISEEAQTKLFQHFSQADSSVTRNFGGTGLGLVIAKRFCELMGGSLTCKSKLGEGSTFTAKIVAKKFAVKLDMRRSANSLKRRPPAVPSYAQVVVVHPSPKTRESIVKQFHQWQNVCAHHFGSLDEMRHHVQQGKFHLCDMSFGFIDHGEWERVQDRCHPFKQLVLFGTTFPKEQCHHTFLKRPLRSVCLHQLLFPPVVIEQGEVPHDSNQEFPINVLVAEDNLVNQKLIRMMLEKSPFRIDTLTIVDDGKQALEKVEKNHYDIIFMDVMMPNLDGLQATKEIRKLSLVAQPHIIGLTASAFDDDKKRCIESGMNVVVTKPIDRLALHKSIQDTFASSAASMNVPTIQVV